MPRYDAIRNKVRQPDKARTMLRANYILHGALRKEAGGRILVTASLTDTRALVQLREFRADYSPEELRNVPVALAGMVTATLRLPPLSVSPTVDPAAYPAYATGISTSRRTPPVDSWRAMDSGTTDGDAWRRIGKVYENSNQPARAVDAYHKAIEVDPKYWRNYQDLGTFYFYRDAYDEAIQQYKKLVEVAPDLAASHYALAAPYLNLGRYADAEYELNTALGLQEFPNAREGLGLSLVYQGRDREAVPHFKRAIEIGSPSALYYLNLGTALR